MAALFASVHAAAFGRKQGERAQLPDYTAQESQGQSRLGEDPFGAVSRFPALDRECQPTLRDKPCCSAAEHPGLQNITVGNCAFADILQCYAGWHSVFIAGLEKRRGECSRRQPLLHRITHGFADSMGQLSNVFEKALVSGRPFFLE